MATASLVRALQEQVAGRLGMLQKVEGCGVHGVVGADEAE